MPATVGPAGMRYARSAPPPARKTPGGGATRSTRRRPVVVAAALVSLAGAGVGIAVAAGGPAAVVERTPAARAVAAAFVRANVLAENLGAPVPPGQPEGSAAWALRPVPLVGTASAHPRLARAEHRWLAAPGRVAPLAPPVARRLLATQAQAVRSVFAGPARADELAQLAGLVAGEARARPVPVSPGGARVVRWYALAVHGSTARAEALVTQWEQHDTVVGPPGAQRVVASVTTDAVDATADLVRSGGRWRVQRWSQAPWQQPT